MFLKRVLHLKLLTQGKLLKSMNLIREHNKKLREELINRAAEIFSSRYCAINDQIELIMGILMILLEHPATKNKIHLFLTDDLTTKVEGKLLDKICAVLNKTYLIMGEESTLHDDIALELIRDYLL